MQKNHTNVFLKGRRSINTFLRLKLYVLILLFFVTLASAKSYCASIELQQTVVTGTVTNQQGQPEIGATVVVKGTTIGTITDSNGKYTLANVPANATLVFSFVGMATQEIQLNGRTQIDIVMQESVSSLNEVIVVGYGTQKKASVVGAISQTSNDELKKSGDLPNLAENLQGKLPGVITQTSSGAPGGVQRGGSSTQIYIRGQNTWNGAQPLVLVDGIERNIDNVDVSEVQNVSVLKDASATAVFGVRGANGVILITTKRGTLGKPKISFTYNAVGQQVSKIPESFDSYKAIMLKDKAIEREVSQNPPSWADYTPYPIALRYKKPQLPEYVEIYPDINWEKAMLKNMGYSHHATLDVQGGTNFVRYFGSLSYLYQGDMLKYYENHRNYNPSNSFNRINFRNNLDFKLTRTTTLSVDLAGFYSIKNSGNNWYNVRVGDDNWTWNGLYALAPTLNLPLYSDGYYGYDPRVGSDANSIALIWNQGILQDRKINMNSDFVLEQKLDFIIPGLSAKAKFSFDSNILSEGGILDGNTNVSPSAGNVPIKVINNSLYTGPDQDPSEYTTYYPIGGKNQFDWVPVPWKVKPEVIGPADYEPGSSIPVDRSTNYQFQLNYDHEFGSHAVTALGMVKREQYAYGNEFQHFREDWVFRTTYNYAEKYLFEANGAYNGSEQFGPGYRFHFFPSVAGGWIVTNENFFHQSWLAWVNRLKIRYSMGMVGNDQVSGKRWLYSSQYSYGGSAYLNQDPHVSSPYTWYTESVVGNPDLHWEKALKKDLGIEMGLLNNLISITYDYFTENRTDILIGGSDRTVPPFFGATPPSANLGAIYSNGHELEVRLEKRFEDGFHLWGSSALTHTQNKILKRDDPPLTPSYLKAEGYAIGQVRTQQTAGFMNNWDDVYASTPFTANDLQKQPGYYNLLDFEPDGIMKSEDAAPYGYSAVPQNTYDFSVGADYKGFSFMVEFYGATNSSQERRLYTWYKNTELYFDQYADYWSKDNENASYPLTPWKATGIPSGQTYIIDASYLRLKNVNIGYTFQNQWVKKAGMSGLRIYLNGNNLKFWSKLPDDRESVDVGGISIRGTYPTVKRFTLGVNLTF